MILKATPEQNGDEDKRGDGLTSQRLPPRHFLHNLRGWRQYRGATILVAGRVIRMAINASSQALFGLVAVGALSFGLSGCGEETDAPQERIVSGNIVVFAGSGRLQCDFTGGVTPQQSELKLIREGVDVLRSGCGVMTERSFATVCGGISGEIVLHQIRAVNFDTAERLGFSSVDELKVPGGGIGYAWLDCETGAILP